MNRRKFILASSVLAVAPAAFAAPKRNIKKALNDIGYNQGLGQRRGARGSS